MRSTNKSNNHSIDHFACLSSLPSTVRLALYNHSSLLESDTAMDPLCDDDHVPNSSGKSPSGHVFTRSGYAYVQKGNEIYVWSVVDRINKKMSKVKNDERTPVVTLHFGVSVKQGVTYCPLIAIFRSELSIGQGSQCVSVLAVNCDGCVRYWPSIDIGSENGDSLEFVSHHLKEIHHDGENQVNGTMIDENNLFVKIHVDEAHMSAYVATADGRRVDKLSVCPWEKTVKSTTIFDESIDKRETSLWTSIASWMPFRSEAKREHCVALLPSSDSEFSVISLTDTSVREHSLLNDDDIPHWHLNAQELIRQTLSRHYRKEQIVWLLDATNDSREHYHNIIYLVTASRSYSNAKDPILYHVWVINSTSSRQPIVSFVQLNTTSRHNEGRVRILCALSNDTPILFVLWRNRFVWLRQDEKEVWECAPKTCSLSNSNILGLGVLKMKLNQEFGENQLLYILHSELGVLIMNIQADNTPQSILEINAGFKEINAQELLRLVEHCEMNRRSDDSTLPFGLNVSAETLVKTSKMIANAKVSSNDVKGGLARKQKLNEFFFGMSHREKHSETGIKIWHILSPKQEVEILHDSECLFICLSLIEQCECELVQQAISKCEEKREYNRVCEVKNNELFFSDASLVLEVYEELVAMEKCKIFSISADGVYEYISTISSLLTDMRETIMKHRVHMTNRFGIGQNWGTRFSSILWDQFDITRSEILSNPWDNLYPHMFNIADFYLDSKYNLAEVTDKQKLDDTRCQVINLLGTASKESNWREKVLLLAKKYKDMARLAHWCFELYDQEGFTKLKEFTTDTQENPELMHQILHYFETHERFELLLAPQFVQSYPEYIAHLVRNRSDLKWMFAVERNDMLSAVAPLLHWGKISKDTSFFSILKLVGLAGDDTSTTLTAAQTLTFIRSRKQLEEKLNCAFSNTLDCASLIMELCITCTTRSIELENRDRSDTVLYECLQIGFNLFDLLKLPAAYTLTTLWSTAWEASCFLATNEEQPEQSIFYRLLKYTSAMHSRMTENVLAVVKNGLNESEQRRMQNIYDIFCGGKAITSQ